MNAEILVSGSAGQGEALILSAPISFWGGVDPRSGLITDVRHPQHGESVAGKVLLELVHNGHAPAALILHQPDAILLLGLVVAREMSLPTPIALRLDRSRFPLFAGRSVSVTTEGMLSLSGL